jgi:hypothetical protein
MSGTASGSSGTASGSGSASGSSSGSIPDAGGDAAEAGAAEAEAGPLRDADYDASMDGETDAAPDSTSGQPCGAGMPGTCSQGEQCCLAEAFTDLFYCYAGDGSCPTPAVP